MALKQHIIFLQILCHSYKIQDGKIKDCKIKTARIKLTGNPWSDQQAGDSINDFFNSLPEFKNS